VLPKAETDANDVMEISSFNTIKFQQK